MYYVNNAFYKPGGPMFLMFRGESAASISFMVAGAWIKYAEQYGAKLYQLEHRFYGKSVPTPYVFYEQNNRIFEMSRSFYIKIIL